MTSFPPHQSTRPPYACCLWQDEKWSSENGTFLAQAEPFPIFQDCLLRTGFSPLCLQFAQRLKYSLVCPPGSAFWYFVRHKSVCKAKLNFYNKSYQIALRESISVTSTLRILVQRVTFPPQNNSNYSDNLNSSTHRWSTDCIAQDSTSVRPNPMNHCCCFNDISQQLSENLSATCNFVAIADGKLDVGWLGVPTAFLLKQQEARNIRRTWRVWRLSH